MNLYITGGTLVDGESQSVGDILVEEGKIVAVGKIAPERIPAQVRTIDATGKLVTPGFIDAHTHYHLVSRGTVTADSFLEGSRLAAFGGVTTVVDFANHSPNKTLADSARERIAEAKDMAIDYNLHQCVFRLPENPVAQLEELRAMGIASIKVFTTYKKAGLYIEAESLEALFKGCKETGLFVTAHCEDDTTVEQLEEKYANREVIARDHADMRPPEAEALAIQWIGELAHRVGVELFVVHLSSLQGLEKIRELRAAGYRISTETTPHYLFRDRSALEGEEGILYVMTPPLREAAEAKGLWKGLVDGDISMVATDHCAFTREQKYSSLDPRSTFPGIPGTEEMYYLLYSRGVASGVFSMNRLVDLLSVGPAKQFGIYPQKGSFALGSDGDLVIIDPSKQWTITHENQHSAAGYTIFHGEPVESKVTHTILRGRVIMEHDTFYGTPGEGQFVPAR